MERSTLITSDFKRINAIVRNSVIFTFLSSGFKFEDYDVDSAVSDPLLKVYQGIDKYDENRSRTTWFQKLAYNSACDHMRSEGRWRHLHADLKVKTRKDEIVELEVADRKSPRRYQADFQVIINEKLECVERIIDSFDNKAALALRLYANGYSYEELQERLDMSYVALKTLISRCRKELKERFKGLVA